MNPTRRVDDTRRWPRTPGANCTWSTRSPERREERQQQRYDRKPYSFTASCTVCGKRVMEDHQHGVCNACEDFFERALPRNTPFKCCMDERCELTESTRGLCPYCRFNRCEEVGMGTDLDRDSGDEHDTYYSPSTSRDGRDNRDRGDSRDRGDDMDRDGRDDMDRDKRDRSGSRDRSRDLRSWLDEGRSTKRRKHPSSSVTLPSDQNAITEVLSLLCGMDGRATVSDLLQVANGNSQLSFSGVESLTAVLARKPRNFKLKKSEDGDILVSAHTSLQLCPDHCTAAGCTCPFCDELHICKYFLISSCSAEKRNEPCKYGHDYLSEHNSNLLAKHDLLSLLPKYLKLIFQMNRSVATLPMICKFYNMIHGCKQVGGRSCTGMHLCEHHVKGQCKYGTGCKRSHNVLDVQPKTILLQYGFDVNRFSTNVLQELREQLFKDDPLVEVHAPPALRDSLSPPLSPSVRKLTKSVTLPSSASASSGKQENSDEKPQVCLYFLRGKCYYGNNCRHCHATKHYQWQRLVDNNWVHLTAEENVETELNYSDPSKDECFLGKTSSSIKVDFVNMLFIETGKEGSNLRRLGTAYSVQEPDNWNTQWAWYWKDSADKWAKYGESDSKEDFSATLTSEEVEKKYQEDRTQTVSFSTAGYKYQLDLSKMSQVNVVIGTKRPVRRRPVFVKVNYYRVKISMKDILAELEDLRQRVNEPKAATSVTSILVPSHWDFSHKSDDDYFNLIPITNSGSTSQEYSRVEQLFQKTMSGSTIRCVKRIQNIDLWEKFQRKKLRMDRKLTAGVTVDERLLFHGTSKQFVDAICQQGFDWRIHGTSSGAIYGNGSYFAKDARYSSCYTTDHVMLLVRVLVGQYAQGSSGVRLPPPKDAAKPMGAKYDSCVDKTSDPQIFVVFQDDQSYPEYLIEY